MLPALIEKMIHFVRDEGPVPNGSEKLFKSIRHGSFECLGTRVDQMTVRSILIGR